jgi:PKD repeat protein
VQFNDTSTNTPTAWAWDFTNDGVIDSTEKNPSYRYNAPGTYTVNLTASNAAGSDNHVKLDYISVTSFPPIAGFTGTPRSGNAPLTVQFTDLSSGDPTSWAWDFNNNGTIESTVQNPSFTYTVPGTYTVVLTVKNEGGNNTRIEPAYITVTSPINPTVAIVPDTTVVHQGETHSISLVADVLPAGLSGYRLWVNLSHPGIAEIISVSYPDWGILNRTSPLPAESVEMSAVDLNRVVQPGATNVSLGTITIRGDTPGETPVTITILRMDDDTGGPITPSTRNGTFTVVSSGQKASIAGYVSSGSDFGSMNVPGIRIRIAQTAADLNNPSKRWENTTDARGIYTISDLPAGVGLYAVAISPVSSPDAYYERPVQYQVNGGSLITCQNYGSIPRIPPITADSRTQVNWILTRNPQGQVLGY